MLPPGTGVDEGEWGNVVVVNLEELDCTPTLSEEHSAAFTVFQGIKEAVIVTKECESPTILLSVFHV